MYYLSVLFIFFEVMEAFVELLCVCGSVVEGVGAKINFKQSTRSCIIFCGHKVSFMSAFSMDSLKFAITMLNLYAGVKGIPESCKSNWWQNLQKLAPFVKSIEIVSSRCISLALSCIFVYVVMHLNEYLCLDNNDSKLLNTYFFHFIVHFGFLSFHFVRMDFCLIKIHVKSYSVS